LGGRWDCISSFYIYLIINTLRPSYWRKKQILWRKVKNNRFYLIYKIFHYFSNNSGEVTR
jgi:hypothetical protein